MKKIINYISFYLLAFLGFTSCQSDEISNDSTGYLDFDVALDLNPEVIITRAETDVDDLVVRIFGGESYDKTFNSYAELKETGMLELPTGIYTVQAYSAENVKAVSDVPTYFGETTTVNISAGMPTIAEVKCNMREVKIQLILSELLEVGFQDLTASIQLGDENLYDFIIDEAGQTNICYFGPDNLLKIRLTGTYNGLELGTLGEELYIKDIPEIGNIQANTVLLITIKPENTSDMIAQNGTPDIRFNLQSVSIQ